MRQEDHRRASPSSLRQYQWEGISFLVHRHAALLADEMGLGKTVQAAVALQVVFQSPDCERALVIAPASLLTNWERELNRWTPDLVARRVQGSFQNRLAFYRLPIPVLLVSYEQVRVDARHLHEQVHFDLVILDEGQRIKNSASDTSLACRLVPRTRAWALTGTPLENRPNDMISIFRFLKPGLLRPGMTRAEVHGQIREFFLRRRKREVLPELPEILVQDLPIELYGQQLQAYEDLWLSRLDLIRYEDGAPSTADMLGLITRLKQLCNFDPSSGESAKLDALKLVLDSMYEPTDKAVVFSQYVETLEWIAERLKVPYDILHGSLTSPERDRAINNFEHRSGPRVLLMSLKAGGVGLNLHTASVVILFDRWWNPAVENQAIQRAHRFGRDRPLHVFRFLVVDSIEERIATILGEKQAVFDEYVENAANATVQAFSSLELGRILKVGRPASGLQELVSS